MSALPCVISMQIDAHLAQFDRDEARTEAIEREAAQLLMPGDKCDPFNAGNFEEAIGESSLKQNAEIANALHAGDDAEAGRLLRKLAVDYWTITAKECAEELLDEANRIAAESAVSDALQAAREARGY